MSDVVVHVAVGDEQTETRFLRAVQDFKSLLSGDVQMSSSQTVSSLSSPILNIRTIPAGERSRKALSFADRDMATQFLNFWRTYQ